MKRLRCLWFLLLGFVLTGAARGQTDFLVTITNLAEGQFFSQIPANIPIAVDYREAAVVRVEYFNGDTKIGETSVAPFAWIWTNAPSGTNLLYALATDNNGATTFSPNVTVVVNFAPVATLAEPQAGGEYPVTASLAVSGAASDADGVITNVACYLDGAVVFQTNVAGGFGLELTNLTVGSHILAVVASDNWGVTNPLSPVTFTVFVPDDGIYDDFEPGLHPEAWAEFGGVVDLDVRATNYAGAVSGRNSLWFGSDDDRYAVTRPVAVRAGGVVDFFLRLSGGNSTNWNMVSLPEEGVALEYSINGVDWERLGVYDDYSFTNWQRVTVPIPAAALSTNTQFRWNQLQNFGVGYSHWALDNVQVTTAPTPPMIVTQPQNVVAVEDDAASFSVLLRGNPPFAYQWSVNGTVLPDATNAMLTVPKLTTNMSGWYYTVVVTNVSGAVTSALARLTVSKGETDLFRIVSFGTTRPTVVDHDTLTGDDHGGIAVSSSQVFITGDSSTARYTADTLGNGVRLNRVMDGLAANLRTETIYSLGVGTNFYTAYSYTPITTLLELDGATGNWNGNIIPLSQPIPMDYYYGGVFSGSDRIVVYNGNHVYHISLPSGVVSDMGYMYLYPYVYSETWAFWGVAECFSNSLYLVYVRDSTSIVRVHVPDGETTVLQSFSNLGDMANFTLSLSRQRWYFHHENTSQFANSGEKLGYLPVTIEYSKASPPFLLANPLDQAFARGSTGMLAVADAGNLPRTYQWYRNGQLVSEGQVSMLTIPNAQFTDIGAYQVVIANPYGSVTSSVFNVTVGEPPQITLNPTNQTVMAGDAMTLSVAATGTAPLNYQWFYQDWYDYGETNPVLTIPSIQYYSGGPYYAVVSNLFGVATSKVAQVTVLSPPVITVQPASTKVVLGGTNTLAVEAIGTAPLAYQWYHGGNALAGARQTTLTITNLQVADLGDYFVVITNQYGAATSSVASLSFVELIPGVFRITALLTNHSKVVDHDAITGDDRGGIAIASNYVFYSGDNSTARFSAADITGGTALNRVYDYLISDLRTETIYSLGLGTNLVTTTYGRVDSLIELNGVTLQPVGRSIQLSEPFTNNYSSLMCAGYGRVAYWDSNTRIVYDIALPSGQVTTYGPVDLPNKQYSENWASWGVVEVIDGLLHLAYVGGYNPTNSYQQIVRTRAIDGLTTPVAEYANLSDMACFTVSVRRQRWYFHYEGSGLFGGTAETLGYADATFQVTDTNGPPQVVAQPQDITVPVGGATNLSVLVGGALPYAYQWRFNSANLPDATNATLLFTNVQLAQDGFYSVVVTNPLGVVTSQTAHLTVDPGSFTNRVFLFGITNLWKYNQDGINLGTAWRETNYNDSAWPSGRGILAQENNTAITPFTNTVLKLTNSSGATNITFYFRTWVVVPNYPGATRVQLVSSNLVDDGAVFYLNGAEQSRLRFNTSGTINYGTFAQNTVSEGVYDVIPFLVNDARMGASNLLAVEVHQSQLISSDVVFGMGLYANVVYPKLPPVITLQPADQSVTAGYLAMFVVGVTDGPPFTVQWYLNNTKLENRTNTVLILASVQTNQAGAYTAVITNPGGSVTSRLATLTVRTPPAIVQQPQSQSVEVGSNIVLSVTVTGASPLNYQWWQNGLVLSGGTNALLTLSNAVPAYAGNYTVVVSNALGVATSAPAAVTIIGPRLLLPALVSSNGAFHLSFSSVPGTAYEIQASQDLNGWSNLITVTNLTGSLEFYDYNATNLVRRYYRLHLLP